MKNFSCHRKKSLLVENFLDYGIYLLFVKEKQISSAFDKNFNCRKKIQYYFCFGNNHSHLKPAEQLIKLKRPYATKNINVFLLHCKVLEN